MLRKERRKLQRVVNLAEVNGVCHIPPSKSAGKVLKGLAVALGHLQLAHQQLGDPH
jgi:hypothetical protein